MTEYQARELAKLDRYYRAKQARNGTWGVWDDKADHWVEFDHPADCRCRLCAFSPLYFSEK